MRRKGRGWEAEDTAAREEAESGEADIRMSQKWATGEWSVEDNKFLFPITKHFLEFRNQPQREGVQ